MSTRISSSGLDLAERDCIPLPSLNTRSSVRVQSSMLPPSRGAPPPPRVKLRHRAARVLLAHHFSFYDSGTAGRTRPRVSSTCAAGDSREASALTRQRVAPRAPRGDVLGTPPPSSSRPTPYTYGRRAAPAGTRPAAVIGLFRTRSRRLWEAASLLSTSGRAV